MDFAKQHELVKQRRAALEEKVSRPEMIGKQREMTAISRELRRLERLDVAFTEREEAMAHLEEARELLDDKDMAEMAELEADSCERKIEELGKKIRLLLLPPDPNDAKNTIVEIRAGTGGEEAALFAADLARMYQRYCEIKGWRMNLISIAPTELGGFKEAIFSMEGENVYSQMKYESGTHRVQRVPATEAAGRIHTSAVTVAVLPEAEEVDIAIKPEDLRIDTFHSTGPGGQSVNTTDSAVRITYLPTGMIVSCQDEKSQIKNRVKALKVLRARLLEAETQRQQEARSEARSKQIGTGDRSQRIRTYNFPENRLTDHRVNFRSKNLEQILEGQLEPLFQALIADEQGRRLQEAGAGMGE